ncbi:TspO/MBR family protein [Tenacibaculum sp. SG-28]|uniref:TspO/MBR family protein n=1 Tax=Tenacibaculum sp. SG-28 TaxID=754426 RepID=UPI000CF4FB3A|nr:TspO/MBR family protein [Tenacibaculum sp. SG-28]PQJ23235.1 TspO protein [Tenacibaculum sp. SG-28]
MSQKKLGRFLLFLAVNFFALYVGVQLMGDGSRSEWYVTLNKAPWGPPNWLFGVAWTTIMVLYALYMTKLTFAFPYFDKKLLFLYSLQWVLNVSWNYAFFNKHNTVAGLIIIISLLVLIAFFTGNFRKETKVFTIGIVPYLIWLALATSLNAYIVFNN